MFGNPIPREIRSLKNRHCLPKNFHHNGILAVFHWGDAFELQLPMPADGCLVKRIPRKSTQMSVKGEAPKKGPGKQRSHTQVG